MTTVPTDTPDTAALQTVGTADHLAEATVVLVGPTAPTVLVVMVHLEAVMAVAVVATAATSSGTVVLVGMTTGKQNDLAISLTISQCSSVTAFCEGDVCVPRLLLTLSYSLSSLFVPPFSPLSLCVSITPPMYRPVKLPMDGEGKYGFPKAATCPFVLYVTQFVSISSYVRHFSSLHV